MLASDETVFFYVTPLLAHLTIAEISVALLLKTNRVDLATRKRVEAALAEELDAASDKEFDVKSKDVSLELEGPCEAREPSKHVWPRNAWIWSESALLDYSISWFKHVQEADAIEKITGQHSKEQRLEAGAQPDPEVLRSRNHCLSFNKQSLRNGFIYFKNWSNTCCRYILGKSGC